ncbi:hypothetical protein [Rhodoferax bucti]|uniref:hypothetical protein n=1 Tax=Rhodoferax bucti TaxID=2576305 RepID=UPI0011082408|nr:hypothetical protein [Rhodoferax bucti]
MLLKQTTYSTSAVLLQYAESDSLTTGMPLPVNTSDPDQLIKFMSRAGGILFLHGDPNLDNQKRNIAIQVFVSFQPNQIFDFCRSWLRKWSQNKGALWYQEWQSITDRADPTELADILLSHDEHRVRQRLSSPVGEMLDFETILKIKRATQDEAA